MARNQHLSDTEFYRFHVENLKSLVRAINQIETLSKEAIKQQQHDALKSLLCTHIFLVGASTECRLKKLLYEAGGFTQAERDTVKGINTQQDKWKHAIELGFKRRYKVVSLTRDSLGHTAFARYRTMMDALTDDIAPIIMIRNKLAHGQWEYQLTNGDEGIAQDAMNFLRTENLLSSKFKFQIIKHITALIHDLVVSASFERDFDDHYRKFDNAQVNLKNRSYADYVTQLQDRFIQGQSRRKESSTGKPSLFKRIVDWPNRS